MSKYSMNYQRCLQMIKGITDKRLIQRKILVVILDLYMIFCKNVKATITGYCGADAASGKDMVIFRDVYGSEIMSKLDPEELSMFMLGLAIHEMYHLFYTDFDKCFKLMENVVDGRKPEFKNLNKSCLPREVKLRLIQHFCNIVEDAHIERRGAKNYPKFAMFIDYVNMIYRQYEGTLADRAKEAKGAKFAIFFFFVLHFAVHGRKLNFEGVPEDMRTLCLANRRAIMNCVYENNSEKRCYMSIALLDRLLPELEEVSNDATQGAANLTNQQMATRSDSNTEGASRKPKDVQSSGLKKKKRKPSAQSSTQQAQSQGQKDQQEQEQVTETQVGEQPDGNDSSQSILSSAEGSEPTGGEQMQDGSTSQGTSDNAEEEASGCGKSGEKTEDGKEDDTASGSSGSESSESPNNEEPDEQPAENDSGSQDEGNKSEQSESSENGSDSTEASASPEQTDSDLEDEDAEADDFAGSDEAPDDSGSDSDSEGEDSDPDFDESDYEDEHDSESMDGQSGSGGDRGGTGVGSDDGDADQVELFMQQLAQAIQNDTLSCNTEEDERKALRNSVYDMSCGTNSELSRSIYRDYIKPCVKSLSHPEARFSDETRKLIDDYVKKIVRMVDSEVKTRTEGGLLTRQMEGTFASYRAMDYVTKHGVDRYRMFDKNIPGEEGLDIAVQLLIDESGSMKRCKENTVIIASILHGICEKLGIPIRVASFDDQCYLYCDFDAPMKTTFEKQICNYQPSGGTDEASALTCLEQSLLKRPESFKYLFLITDGAPGFYTTSDMDNRTWLRKYQKSMIKKGVQMVACCTGSNAEAVAQIYDGPKIIYNDYPKLARRLTNEFLRPIRSM